MRLMIFEIDEIVFEMICVLKYFIIIFIFLVERVVICLLELR